MSFPLPQWLRTDGGPLTRSLTRVESPFGQGQVPEDLRPTSIRRSVCGFCSTGCGLDMLMDADGEALGLAPAADYPVNRGTACPKGWEALQVLDAPDRATSPLRSDGSGNFAPIGWPEALDEFVGRFKAIIAEHGPESVAFLSTGQITSEEMALLGTLAKFGMGIVHGDGNTRQCMATAVAAYKESFGFDAPPYSYDDFEESDVIVLVGSNLCIAHPILWSRVMRNRRGPEIIVVDPRRTETAAQATLHVPIAPKSDLALFYGLARQLIADGAIDRGFIDAHTRDFDAFADFARPFDLAATAEATGLAPEAIASLAEKLRPGRRVSYWWTMGVNQGHQGVKTAQAIINLALMTGMIGKPGTGANSITGQCNAMGSRLFSNTTNLLGGRDFANAEHREEVARILEIPAERIPAKPSLAYPEIVRGIPEGKIRGLWVIGTNPAHSWIDQNDFARALDRLDFLVVQDMYRTTETARRADLILPAAGWGEKEGTFINSERRVGVVRKVRRAPGQALADFAIFRLIAERWGVGDHFRGWTSPAAAFGKLKALSAGRPCDISGIRDYEHLDESGGLPWPFKPGQADPTPRLFADGRFCHADGRARFISGMPTPPPEVPDADYPLWLITGRGTAAQWHTQTRTAKSPVLRDLAPKTLTVEVHPDDARAAGLGPGDWAAVESRRGMARAKVVITSGTPRGKVFLPMHEGETNRLTFPAFDPTSRQPAYKSCAVRIRRAIEPPRPFSHRP